MKKICCYLILIICLTGCNEKKMSCSSKIETSDFTIVETLSFKFDKNGSQITKGKYNLMLTISSDYVTHLDYFKGQLALEYENIYKLGVKREMNIKDNELNFELKYNSKKYDLATKEKLVKYGVYSLGNYDYVKKELEKDGYICN